MDGATVPIFPPAAEETFSPEDLCRILFREATDGMFIAEPDGRIISVNPCGTALSGYSIEEFRSMSISDFIPPEDLAREPLRIEELCAGKIVMVERRFRRKDGSLFPVEINVKMLPDGKLVGGVRDISARKKAEETLHNRTRQLETLRQVSTEIAHELDLSRLLGLIHRRAAELIGAKCGLLSLYDEAEGMFIPQSWEGHGDWMESLRLPPGEGITGTVGKNRRGMVVNEYRTSPYTRPAVLEHAAVTAVVAEPLIYRDRLVGVVTVDNEGLPGRTFTEDDQAVLNLFAAQAAVAIENARLLADARREVVERTRAEEDLRKLQRFQETIFEESPHPIWVSDEKGTMIRMNRACRSLFQSTDEIAVGKYNIFDDAAARGGEKLPLIRKVFEEAETVHFTSRYTPSEIPNLRLARTEPLIMEITIAPVVDARGKVIHAIVQHEDITQRRRMEAERVKLAGQLADSRKMEAIGTLAGGIAHDFNNLLMGIQGYTSLMMMGTTPSHPNHARLRAIESQVRSGAALTKQLLGYARGGRYEVKALDMNSMLVRTADMFGRTKKELTIHRSLGGDLWEVEADAGQIEQVLLNLFVNAWQAMPGGGDLYLETANVVLNESDVAAFGIAAGPYVRISVTDTGVGMDETTMSRIFDPFFTTREMGRGTGLGLASVYGIVTGHKGRITVHSERGRGSTFDIHLPAAAQKIPVAAEPVKTASAQETILLVDDEEIIREVSPRYLSTYLRRDPRVYIQLQYQQLR